MSFTPSNFREVTLREWTKIEANVDNASKTSVWDYEKEVSLRNVIFPLVSVERVGSQEIEHILLEGLRWEDEMVRDGGVGTAFGGAARDFLSFGVEDHSLVDLVLEDFGKCVLDPSVGYGARHDVAILSNNVGWMKMNS